MPDRLGRLRPPSSRMKARCIEGGGGGLPADLHQHHAQGGGRAIAAAMGHPVAASSRMRRRERVSSEAGIETRVGLLGTRFTMEQDFYRGRLEERFGLTVQAPDAASRELVHEVIYQELCRGVVSHASREAFQRIVSGWWRRAARG